MQELHKEIITFLEYIIVVPPPVSLSANDICTRSTTVVQGEKKNALRDLVEQNSVNLTQLKGLHVNTCR